MEFQYKYIVLADLWQFLHRRHARTDTVNRASSRLKWQAQRQRDIHRGHWLYSPQV